MHKRKALTAEPNVKIEDIIAAREGRTFPKGKKRIFIVLFP